MARQHCQLLTGLLTALRQAAHITAQHRTLSRCLAHTVRPGSLHASQLLPAGQKRPDGSSVNLLYKRTFSVPSAWGGSRVLLHFGAVDYECTVSVNHLMLGVHHGG